MSLITPATLAAMLAPAPALADTESFTDRLVFTDDVSVTLTHNLDGLGGNPPSRAHGGSPRSGARARLASCPHTKSEEDTMAYTTATTRPARRRTRYTLSLRLGSRTAGGRKLHLGTHGDCTSARSQIRSSACETIDPGSLGVSDG